MDALPGFLDTIRKADLVRGHFLGFLHVLIGRRVRHGEHTICAGLTWRELAQYLKKVRWDPECVRELGLSPDDLPPRDRERFWYSAITRAGVDSAAARQAGDQFAELVRKKGYEVSS